MYNEFVTWNPPASSKVSHKQLNKKIHTTQVELEMLSHRPVSTQVEDALVMLEPTRLNVPRLKDTNQVPDWKRSEI